mmetsp:Transcript_3282/g.9388  ORF Transcript_3282/g.9388 Transcript_3282/m.9388 type:complete len:258 (+) Transcript_3282:258-1031(+)
MAPSDTDLTGTDDILLMLLPRGTDADGFSSSSLQLYLENIREKALQVSASLYDCLDAACASNDPLDSATLESLREVLGADKKPEAATLAVVVESHSALARQVKEARARYSGLKAQAGRTQQLLEVAENTKAGRFSAAATALREMEATVSATASSPCDGDGRADSGITAAKRELQELLLKGRSGQYQATAGYPQVKFCSSPSISVPHTHTHTHTHALVLLSLVRLTAPIQSNICLSASLWLPGPHKLVEVRCSFQHRS